MKERASQPENWIPRKGENRQKIVNYAGTFTVSVTLLLLAGSWKMIMEIKDNVRKSDVNTQRIEKNFTEIDKNNLVLHRRINDNVKEIRDVRDMAIESRERSKTNRQLVMRGIVK